MVTLYVASWTENMGFEICQEREGKSTNEVARCICCALHSYRLRISVILVRMAATRSLLAPVHFIFCKYPQEKCCHRFGAQDHRNPSPFRKFRSGRDVWNRFDWLDAKPDSGKDPGQITPRPPQK